MSHTKRVLEKIQACEALNQNEKVFSGLGNAYFTIVECKRCNATGKVPLATYVNNGNEVAQELDVDVCDTCKGFKYLSVPSDDAYVALTDAETIRKNILKGE